jgi:hypothetical protein
MTDTNAPDITIKDHSERESLGAFLDKVTCAVWRPDRAGWEAKVLEQSPVLGPYLISGWRNKVPVSPNAIRLDLPEPRHTGPPRFSAPWNVILDALVAPLAIICAAGGSKAFLSLLKAWVEERKGRRVVVEHKGSRIEIQGGVSKKQVKELVRVFEETFQGSRIIKP